MIRNNSALYVSLINLIGLEMLPNRFKEKCCVNIDPTVIRLCNDNNFFFFHKNFIQIYWFGPCAGAFLGTYIYVYLFAEKKKNRHDDCVRFTELKPINDDTNYNEKRHEKEENLEENLNIEAV